ncbi:MAG: DUF4340 domain-containing protein [Ruminococcaceae bacterium]|nr:DUF4340 domain-containing protein [Oscillospiraceae bacterium]
MDKKTLRILILLAVLALLCVGLAAVAVVNSIRDAEGDELETTESNEVVVMRVDEASVYYFSYTHDNDGDGTAEELEFSLGSDSKSWYWHENTKIKLREGIISTFASNLNQLTSTQVIKNPTDKQLKNFGFDAPTKYVTVRDNVYGEQTLTFGVYNSYNSCHYVCLNGNTETIYLISSDVFTGLETSVEAFVYLESFPEIAEDCMVSLVYSDGEREVICQFVQPEDESTVSGTWHRSIDGGEFTEIPSAVSTALTKLVSGMEYLSCVSVYESKLSEYGFEKTDDGIVGEATMTVNYRTKTRVLDEATNEIVIEWEDKSFEISLGGLNDYNYYYANPEGTSIAVMLGGSAYYKVFNMTDAELAAEK